MDQVPQGDPNPYASPLGGLLPEEPDRPRFRILAVIVGWLVDLVSSMISGAVLGIYLVAVLMSQKVRPEQLEQALGDMTGLQIAGLLAGLGGTVLGGYVAAWMAKHWELRHALATGLLSLGMGFVWMALASLLPIPVSPPTWSNAIAFTGTLPAALLGGWIRSKVAERKRR